MMDAQIKTESTETENGIDEKEREEEMVVHVKSSMTLSPKAESSAVGDTTPLQSIDAQMKIEDHEVEDKVEKEESEKEMVVNINNSMILLPNDTWSRKLYREVKQEPPDTDDEDQLEQNKDMTASQQLETSKPTPSERDSNIQTSSDRSSVRRPRKQKFPTQKEVTVKKGKHIDVMEAIICHICGREFTHKKALRNHRRIHKGSKDFICNICGKAFHQRMDLDYHFKIHTGERDFKCEICGKGFIRKNDMVKHSKIHTDMKDFQCNVCGKGFSRKCDVKRHSKIHTGVKDFKCFLCGKEFIWKSDLERHSKTHTGAKEDVYNAKLLSNVDSESSSLEEARPFLMTDGQAKTEEDESEDSTEDEESEEATVVNVNNSMILLPKEPWLSKVSSKTKQKITEMGLLYRRSKTYSETSHDGSETEDEEMTANISSNTPQGSPVMEPLDLTTKQYPEARQEAPNAEGQALMELLSREIKQEPEEFMADNYDETQQSPPETESQDYDETQQSPPETESQDYDETQQSPPETESQDMKQDVTCIQSEETGKVQPSPQGRKEILQTCTVPKRHTCDLCDKTFSRKRDLIRHTIVVHPGVIPQSDTPPKRYNCDLCDKSFSRNTDLTRHTKVHTGVMDFKCNVCGKEFFRKSVLIRHSKIHTGLKDFKCDVCGKAFYRKVDMVSHSKIHTGIKEFKCEECGKEFFQRIDMIYHMKMHTGIKEHVCYICGKGFTLKKYMNMHIKIHTEVKDFKCSICGKAFTLKKELNRHSKLHSESKDFKCNVCGKGFVSKGTLNKHLKIHSTKLIIKL